MKENVHEPSKQSGSTYKAQVIEYWDGAPKNESTIEGATKEDVFERFYGLNRTYRYCNGCFFRFKDPAVKKEYDEWHKSLSEMTRFKMYYGDGIVD